MGDYTQANDYSAKDGLPAGNANKKVLGSDIDTELDRISTAISSKAENAADETISGTWTFSEDTTFSKDVIFKQGDDVASATNMTLGDGNYFDITGTTAITSIASKGIGSRILLQFDAILTLTHHATNLILPGAANITTAAGDIAEFYEYASADWRCISYTRKAGVDGFTAAGDSGSSQPIADGNTLTIAGGDGVATVASATDTLTVSADLKSNGGLVIESNEIAVDLGASSITNTLAVGDGGTGATSLTDGGVLLGSGTGAVTAMSVLADSEMIVGDGSTDPVAESGATLRTSIGVGTGDSPQFTAVNIGAASDTTLARSGAGDLTIEGNAVYRAGGTDVPVADGGTGASTLTDGGVLLGSGTSAVTAMSVLSDSEMIVGDGSGDPVAESGATLRTSIGVGTGDSPQLTGIELGHATDTTITRASSGNLNIEGNIVYRAGGTDVPVADGGTGASSLTDGGVLLGSGTGAITAMSVLSDGQMIVGDGSTDPVAESGATLRTSIGVGTGDSPQFTAVNIGAATDTTLARSGAGDLTVEGNAIYRAGGTDVPVADGGTGASTATGGFDALSPMTASGDILYGGSSGTVTKLAKGSDDEVLTLASGVPSWAAASAGTASVATNVTVSANNSTDETTYPVFVDGATGSQGAETDTGLTYNPSSGIITATQFTGAVVGNVTGNASGTAATVTGGTQASITSAANLVTVGTIGTGVWQGTAIASGYIAADAITGAKIADNAIDSEHYTDGSIDNAHIADNAIDSEHYADGSIDTAHLGNLQVTTAKIAADAIDGTKLADNAVDSEHYTDGSIDNAHIADDAIDSEHYAAGSIDTAHIADDQITLAKMASGTDGVIITYDASGNPTHVGPGSDGQVLTSTGAGSPPAFEDAGGGGGKVLQVITGTTTTQVDLDSTTLTDTTLTADITPSASGSKVFILVSQAVANNGRSEGRMVFLRDSTNIYDTIGVGDLNDMRAHHFHTFLDSPSTTSATTYKTQMSRYEQSGTLMLQEASSGSSAKSTIVLVEIGA